MQISETVAPMAGVEPCRFPKLEECAHFHYERVQLPPLKITLQMNMNNSLHSQHTVEEDTSDWYTIEVCSSDERWLIQRNYENFTMLDEQLHQCIYDRKVSQLPELTMDMASGDNLEDVLSTYLARFCKIVDNSLNCGPVLNWFQLDNRGHRLLVPSEESRSINTPAVAAAYSIRKYVSQARDELSLEVGDMISVIDMTSPGESIWWRGKRGFQVGFFPQHCVHIIGDKVPRNMPLPPPVVGSLAIVTSPIRPVLRRHGKLITFFRSFILNRPSRRRLKQRGILKERVFGCDLGEHLLNSGHDIPMVLKCCAEFIESHGIVDGIYRLSGVTSNIQRLRNAFDEDRIPDLYTDDILQDIHSVASLLKMYFRELPNPLCTYQLYHSFVAAVQGCQASQRNKVNDNERLLKMREAVQKLPPPHYRTLEYLMRHLARVAEHGSNTGMTTRNVAIVWAPNLLRCEELEVGGVAALQGVGVQAVVTEFLVCYADLIFCDHLPNLSDTSEGSAVSPKRSRPKSLAISTPTKLITLEEARNKHLLNKNDDCNYIEVGGGPKNLPEKYHTVIDLPAGSRKRGFPKRSPSGWRSFFSKSRNNSQGNLSKNREISSPGITPTDKSVTESDLSDMKRKLRPVKSAESLTSGQSEPTLCELDGLGPLHCLSKPSGHNRSVSHDSYFDSLPSNNNSVGSLLDLSEIQLNFELEESEMRIFSEDESLVSSPKVLKDSGRKVLSRARPDNFSSAANSSNPSPKKQPRVVLSPDSQSRKRSRLEDQLSDIQYIDCNTPENPCIISTTALIHNQDNVDSPDVYQPKNKSPRNSNVNNRHSLNFDRPEKIQIPKSLTEMDIEKLKIPKCESSGFPSPQSPNYKRLESVSSCSTPVVSLDASPAEIQYEKLATREVSCRRECKSMSDYSTNQEYDTPKRRPSSYENVEKSPTYENVCTTINIIYKSPVKVRNAPDSIYEDIELNPEQVIIPTTVASLPVQEATQPNYDFQRDDYEYIRDVTFDKYSETTARVSLETSFDACVTTICSERPSELPLSELNTDSFSCTPVTPKTPKDMESRASLISPTDDPSERSTSDSNGFSSHPIDISSADDCTRNCTESAPSNSSASPPISDSVNVSSSVFDGDVSKSAKDKRKSCDGEALDIDNAVYQQVKYFRRSIHEINSLLDLPADDMPLTKSKSEADCLNDVAKQANGNAILPKDVVYENYEQKCNGPDSVSDVRLGEVFVPDTVSNVRLGDVFVPDTVSDVRLGDVFAPDKVIGDHNFERLNPPKLDMETYDSLEADDVHLYENVQETKSDARYRLHESEPKIVDITNIDIPLCAKCSPEKTSVRSLTSKFETKDDAEKSDKFEVHSTTLPKCKVYDKNSLPPCLRAKHAKASVKTRSLDENAFVTEFGRSSQLQRRKSLDDRTSSYIDSKLLIEKIDEAHSAKTDVKLNRERIEKYKEERRNFLREKYRSESFKEDKDKLLSRLKQKSFKAKEDADKTKNPLEQILDKAANKSRVQPAEEPIERRLKKTSPERPILRFSSDRAVPYTIKSEAPRPEGGVISKKLSVEALSKFESKDPRPTVKKCSPLLDRKSRSSLKEISDKILDDDGEIALRSAQKDDDFIRHRKDVDGDKRRNTYDLQRERDAESESQRRVSLETKNTRKDKCSPSYCIKDMKALFESKSHQ